MGARLVILLSCSGHDLQRHLLPLTQVEERFTCIYLDGDLNTVGSLCAQHGTGWGRYWQRNCQRRIADHWIVAPD